jgi:CBS domain containing-hemolysin-like protein
MLSIGYFWSWVKVAVAWIAPIAFFIIYPELFLAAWYLWVLIIFGAIAWGTSHTMRAIFRQNEQNIINRDKEDDEDDDETETDNEESIDEKLN